MYDTSHTCSCVLCTSNKFIVSVYWGDTHHVCQYYMINHCQNTLLLFIKASENSLGFPNPCVQLNIICTVWLLHRCKLSWMNYLCIFLTEIYSISAY